MRKSMWIVAAALLVTTSALADDEKKSDKGDSKGDVDNASKATTKAIKGHKGKYGTAGCGLGSIIISSGGIVQIFAATTNGTSANQTFGITSGTSNCEDSDSGDEATNVYVQANRVALAKDISRGSGETITNLTALAGCSDAKAVGLTLQHNFKTIFPNESVSSDQVADSIVTTLKSDTSLSCTAIQG